VADERLEREQVRQRLLGWSIACEPIFPGSDVGRDLVLRGGGDTPLDLARVQSIDALGQSLSLALTTALGSDVFNTSFGFDGLNALADEPDPLIARERVRISVIKLLGSDPRVRRIVDVDLGDGRLGRPPAGSRVLDVNVAFETVSLDQASVNLGRVVPGA
jgi:phage baseplate assembly protein W